MSKQNSYLSSLIMVGILFFIFGFVTWLNSTLIPFLKLTCNLDTPLKQNLVTFAFYMAYFFLAIPSSFILKKTGMKKGMALGLVVMAIGAILFIPAANMRNYPLFLIGLFIQGMGLALMQTAVNPYVSILGPIESAAQRISLMGIFNKVAGMIAPIVFGFLLLKGFDGIEKKLADNPIDKEAILSDLSSRIVNPYIVLTVLLLIFAVWVYYSSLPEISSDAENEKSDDATVQNNKGILAQTQVWLGALAIFFYVGAEVMAGDFIGPYGRELGIPLDKTQFFTTFTLGSMLVGYLLSLVLIPKIVSQERWLTVSSIIGIFLCLASFFAGKSYGGYLSIGCIALLGFANAVMWPAIFPLGIRNLGKLTELGSALLIMGIAGGAIVPLVYGILTPILNNGAAAFLVTMLPCYLYVLFFSFYSQRKAI